MPGISWRVLAGRCQGIAGLGLVALGAGIDPPKVSEQVFGAIAPKRIGGS